MSNENVLFYYNPMSRGQVVHRMLEEVNAPYEIKLIDWNTNQHKSPEYLAINPMGKIPAISHQGVVVTEVAAICMYLADAFPEFNLAPRIDDPKRGEYYRWFMFTVNCVEAAVMDKNFPREKNMPPSHLGYGTYETTMQVLNKAVEKDFLIGKQFTAADVYLSSYLHWFFLQKQLAENPVLTSYVARCMDRPAVKVFMEKHQAMMK